MDRPSNLQRPFFTYGIFKPGQIGHFKLREYVDRSEAATVGGELWERDGVPLLDTIQTHDIHGDVLWFTSDRLEEAYDEITDIEPEDQYEWKEIKANTESGEEQVNALVGIEVHRGGNMLQNSNNDYVTNWDGRRHDPMFKEGLEVVEETLINCPDSAEADLKDFFQLQMAYMLLWSAIERYTSLRYKLKGRIGPKLDKLSEEEGFREGLRDVVGGREREIFRADDPNESYQLDSDRPRQSISYYYQIRNNITHRGKGIRQDFEILSSGLDQLYEIFTDHVLEEAFKD